MGWRHKLWLKAPESGSPLSAKAVIDGGPGRTELAFPVRTGQCSRSRRARRRRRLAGPAVRGARPGRLRTRNNSAASAPEPTFAPARASVLIAARLAAGGRQEEGDVRLCAQGGWTGPLIPARDLSVTDQLARPHHPVWALTAGRGDLGAVCTASRRSGLPGLPPHSHEALSGAAGPAEPPGQEGAARPGDGKRSKHCRALPRPVGTVPSPEGRRGDAQSGHRPGHRFHSW